MQYHTISWIEFVQYIQQIKEYSDNLNDNWALHGNTTIEGDAYLTHRTTKHCLLFGEMVLLVFEYHAIYNVSYGVPNICFNINKEDGSVLSLEECVHCLGLSKTESHAMLTQMDHPVLHLPYLTLHPCRTEGLISGSFGRSKNPIVSWLSAIGPMLKLQIDTIYARLTL